MASIGQDLIEYFCGPGLTGGLDRRVHPIRNSSKVLRYCSPA